MLSRQSVLLGVVALLAPLSVLSGAAPADASSTVRLVVTASRVPPGARELVGATVPVGRWCVLVARHPRARHVRARHVASAPARFTTGVGQFSWQVAARAWRGRWRLTLGCSRTRTGAAHRVFRWTAHTVVRVVAPAGSPTRPHGRITGHITVDVLHAASFGPVLATAACPPRGAVEIPAADWMRSRGGGVDVLSNGPACTSTDQRTHPYQCVDLVNRLLVAKRWSSTINGDAWTFYANAPSASFTKHPPGSGYIPVPGDIVVWGGTGDAGRFGHVQVVDSVSGNTVHVVQENAAVGPRTDLQISSDGRIPAISWPGNTEYVEGILHARRNLP